MIRSPRVEQRPAPTARDRPSRRPRRSSGFTYAGAPPCSGPESAPTADESAAPQSAPVEAATRAVKVEALRPCSAVQIQYVSIAFTALGSASPRQRSRNFSAAVLALGDHLVGDRLARAVRDARGARDDRHHLGGEPAEVLARLLVRDLVELAEPPDARRDARSRPGGRRARCRSAAPARTAPAPASPSSRSSSTSRPQTLLVRIRGRRAPRCRRRGTEARRLRDRAPRSPSRPRRRPRAPA